MPTIKKYIVLHKIPEYPDGDEYDSIIHYREHDNGFIEIEKVVNEDNGEELPMFDTDIKEVRRIVYDIIMKRAEESRWELAI